MRRIVALAALMALASASAAAQQSASYRLKESAFNSGGRPQQGTVAASGSYRITLDAIGDAVLRVGLASASFRVDSGFASLYPPPGETLQLVFSSRTTLTWRPERSTGAYNLYRDGLAGLPGGYGECLQASLAMPSWDESGTPGPGTGWFYLVTAENRIGEEGTKGFRSDGGERANPSPCP